MKSIEIRKKFIEFFKQRGHKVASSAPIALKSEIDQSTLFTSAGMQQFKEFYSHPEKATSARVVSVQKCLRTSDIEEVGDESHLTYFEMLGNFSFGYPEKKGSYFKTEAIEMAWEFLISDLGIDKSRIHATYFKGDKKREVLEDKESLRILENITGLKEIKPQGFDDNFWTLGTPGSPGGPTVEFYVDGIEVWNLVFNEYVFEEGKFQESRFKGVDTGMGIERLAAMMQEKEDVFKTDLFESIIFEIEKVSGKKYSENKRAFRIIADHLRAAAFLSAEGLEPSNIGAGYILRRLIRRAIVTARELGIKNDLIKNIIPIIEAKPNLQSLENEEKKFRETLETGLKKFEKRILGGFGSVPFGGSQKILDAKTKISGKDLFDLHQTYGFPLELSLEIIKEKVVPIEKNAVDDYQKEMRKHQEKSRTASKGMFKSGLADSSEKTTKLHTVTHILHQVLREILGDHVEQKGQHITEERLRFDFLHPEKLSDEQIQKIENRVNEIIFQKLPVKCEEMSVEKAKAQGARAQFLDKYTGKITMYSIGDYSKELCKGPHAKNTSELGKFKILKEESSSAGVRRIKAVLE